LPGDLRLRTSGRTLLLFDKFHRDDSTPAHNQGLKNYVCAKIVSGNETYIYSFPIVVDKLTVLSIKNMNSNLTNLQNATNANKNISLNLQFQNSAQVLELVFINQRSLSQIARPKSIAT
jgi:hypothetical protein